MSGELLNALDAFDERTRPLGLYACEEFQAKDKPYIRLYQEWHLCLKPCLEALGCRIGRSELRNGTFQFDLPDGTRATMHVVRTSKIKVRKFGSAYRVDSHHKYHVAKELKQLEEQLRWVEHGAHYATKTWADREDRAFYVRLSVWSRSNP